MLLAIYFSAISILNSFDEAISQFSEIWYWIILLTVGFGIQVGLFFHIKVFNRAKTKGLGAEVTASGGVSTVSMIACCAHYLVGILPLLGLSAAALFLVKYQVSFLLVGIFTNILGIIVMLMKIQMQKLYKKDTFLRRIENFNLKTAFYSALLLSIFALTISFIVITRDDNPISTEYSQVPDEAQTTVDESTEIITENIDSHSAGSMEIIQFESLVDSRNGINIEVVPVGFNFNEPFEIFVGFNTHSGNLGFKVDKIVYLEDSDGTVYHPLRWEGDPPGGHHRSGKLLFPALNKNVSYIKLVMKGVNGIETRSFKWELPV
jgi:hypothetical protein